MKKNLLYAFALICSLSFFTACSDDEENANWTKLPTETISAENLTLTTNSQSFPNASVSLAMTDAQNGVLTLNNAVRGLNEVAVNVSVAEQSDGSFSFQGTNSIATTKAVADLVSSIDVNVAGTITLDGKATVEVTSAANGFLVKKWNLCDKTYTDPNTELVYGGGKIRWTSSYMGGWGGQTNTAEVTQQIGTLALSAIMNMLLRDVEFKADGSIVANYAKDVNLDKDAIMGSIFGGGADASDIEWIASPANLAYWYAKDNNIYLQLDIAAIIAQAMDDEGGEGMDASAIMAVLEQIKGMSGAEVKALLSALLQGFAAENPILAKIDINQISDEGMEQLIVCLTEGFPLLYDITTPVIDDNGTERQLNDVYVYLNQDFFNIIMPAVLPLLTTDLDAMAEQAIGAQYWSLLKMVCGFNSLTDFKDVWAQTTEFKLGLDLADGSFKVETAPAE